jgi:hypothetical protein
MDNLVLCCQRCNSSKGAKTLEEYRAHRLKKSLAAGNDMISASYGYCPKNQIRFLFWYETLGDLPLPRVTDTPTKAQLHCPTKITNSGSVIPVIPARRSGSVIIRNGARRDPRLENCMRHYQLSYQRKYPWEIPPRTRGLRWFFRDMLRAGASVSKINRFTDNWFASDVYWVIAFGHDDMMYRERFGLLSKGPIRRTGDTEVCEYPSWTDDEEDEENAVTPPTNSASRSSEYIQDRRTTYRQGRGSREC